MTDFGTPVQTVDTFTQGGIMREWVIEPRGNWEHTAYHRHRFIIEVKQQVDDPSRLVRPGFIGESCRSTFRTSKCARCCRSSPISRPEHHYQATR